jgi:AcrR family transcriptional regulator
LRLTRAERKEQTRDELVATARRLFTLRGFHQALLDEIAEDAGYSKGAVYSNFASKDELFLAVLDAQYAEVLRTHSAIMRRARTFDSMLRAVARLLAEQARNDPAWSPVLIEFWTQASRRPGLRSEVAKRHEQQLDAVAALLSEQAERHGVEFLIPEREAARYGTALGRGIALERLLDPDFSTAWFEDMFVRVVGGLVRPRDDGR